MSIDDWSSPSAILVQKVPSTGEMHATLLCARSPSHPQGLLPLPAEVRVTCWQYEERLHNPVASYAVLLFLWQEVAMSSKKEKAHLLGDRYRALITSAV